MRLVKNIAEIENNAITFLDTIYGGRPDAAVAVQLVKSGKVFLPFQFEGVTVFVPSKFIGYAKNSVTSHKALIKKEGRDGRVTNREICGILGKYQEDSHLDGMLRSYCLSLGVSLDNFKHKFWRVETIKRGQGKVGSAVDDIDVNQVGNDDPEYRRRMSGSYVRDPKVREKVRERADGRCEYGTTLADDESCSTFRLQDGRMYLESHHIIKLSEQGADKYHNVIALCATHHREAHFGERWRALQDEFMEIVARKLV